MQPKLVFVYGTRPESIKIGPIAALLPSSVYLSTGQHVELLKGTPAESDLKRSLSLNLESNGDVGKWVALAVPRLTREFISLAPIGWVVVQGDTMSAYAGTLAAFGLGIPVVHIEAGLRSGNLQEPWPEERIRRGISMRAAFHLCPTERAKQNLLAEGIPECRVRVTGNPVVSAIHRYADPTPVETPESQIFVTMHRREWTEKGKAHVLKTIFALVEQALKNPSIKFLWPMHPGVSKLSGMGDMATPKNVVICPPLAYQETIKQLKVSIGVATDSGGLQEEAAVLGVPCAVLRNLTDRPESVEAGIAKLFSPGPEGIKAAIQCLIARELPRKPSNIYGTPESAKLIADQLQALVSES
jgi:UDP-N-acetylglucosamine 2-epimerase (non-hydrolysing)